MTMLHFIVSSKLTSTSVYLTTFILEDSDGFIYVCFSCFPRFCITASVTRRCFSRTRWCRLLLRVKVIGILPARRLDLQLQKVWQQKTVYEAAEYSVKFDTLEYVIINNKSRRPLRRTQRSSLTSLTRSPSTFATMRRISMILGVSSIKSSAIQKGPLTT